jgi:chaperonin cofactor prefoldin
MFFMTRKAYENDLREAKAAGAEAAIKDITTERRFEDIYTCIDRNTSEIHDYVDTTVEEINNRLDSLEEQVGEIIERLDSMGKKR